MVKDYSAYLQEFLQWCEYPPEAVESLMKDYRTILEHPEASERFHMPIRLYEADMLYGYWAATESVSAVPEMCGVPLYAVHLLLPLCMTRHAKDLYEAKGLSREIYRTSMLDLKWKMLKCHKIHGIWGTMAGNWFGRFFMLTRFGLGRLQFELAITPRDFAGGGYRIRKGDLVVNIHIPGSGPLTQEACMDAFRQAEGLFKPLFGDRPVAFTCDSWLLYPEHKKMLPKESNVRGFMDCFTIVESGIREMQQDMWRIFYTMDFSDMEKLPQDTTLQRAYVKFFQDGGKPGDGIGYFFMKDGELVK